MANFFQENKIQLIFITSRLSEIKVLSYLIEINPFLQAASITASRYSAIN
jgi:hypothetical protein